MRRKFTLAVCVIFIGCSPVGKGVLHVTGEEYAKRQECWTENNRELAAFAIFDDAKDGYVPFFISFKCVVTEEGSNVAQARIENINAFRVKESQTNLRKFGFGQEKFFSNDSVELKIPGDKSKVYFIVASYSRDGDEAEIGEFRWVVDTGSDFERFLELSDREIYELGSRFSGMSR